MEKRIAVLSDAAGSPTTLLLAEFVYVYERGATEWREISRFSLKPFAADTPHGIRLLGEAISDEFGDSKVILGSDISGASYSALNRVGFLICESEGISDEIFDELFGELDADEDVILIEKSKDVSETAFSEPEIHIMGPQPSALPGHFFISLKEVQQSNPLLSTKKILRPFLKETPFVELVILCGHIPPWLETDLTGLGLSMTSRKSDSNTIVLTVVHAACDQISR